MALITRFGSRREPKRTRNYRSAPGPAIEPVGHFKQARKRNESSCVEKIAERNTALVANWALRLRSGVAGLFWLRCGGYLSVPGPREPQSSTLARRPARSRR